MSDMFKTSLNSTGFRYLSLACFLILVINGCASMSRIYRIQYIGEQCINFPGVKVFRLSTDLAARQRFLTASSSYLKELGMIENQKYSDLERTFYNANAWYRSRTTVSTKFEGQDSKVIVAIDADCLLVVITDLDHNEKTRFMAELEGKMSSFVKQDFGVHDVSFERTFSPFGP